MPENVLTNHDLARMVETSNEWILERTGIRERHIAPPEMATSDMATEAARIALANAGVDAKDVDAIILCTVTPDHMFPSTACLVQHAIGATGAWGFDLVAACSSFVYGLTTAAHLVSCGTHKRVLVIGSDTMSRIIDYTDRATCILFGDGAGAMLVEQTTSTVPPLPAFTALCTGPASMDTGSSPVSPSVHAALTRLTQTPSSLHDRSLIVLAWDARDQPYEHGLLDPARPHRPSRRAARPAPRTDPRCSDPGPPATQPGTSRTRARTPPSDGSQPLRGKDCRGQGSRVSRA